MTVIPKKILKLLTETFSGPGKKNFKTEIVIMDVIHAQFREPVKNKESNKASDYNVFSLYSRIFLVLER